MAKAAEQLQYCTANIAETVGAAPVTKEAAENIARASQNGRTINVAWTSRVVPLVKEAAQSVVEVYHFVRAAKVTETMCSSWNSSSDCSVRDTKLEQLNETSCRSCLDRY